MVLGLFSRGPEKSFFEFEPATTTQLLVRTPVKLFLHHAYHLFSSLRTPPTPNDPPIRVVCISDTHDQLPEHVPDGDILVHAGDLTNAGTVADLQKQIDWLAALPHGEVVVIAGNHDTYLDPRTRSSLNDEERSGGLDWKRVHYLQHKSITLSLAVDRSISSSVDADSPRQRLLSGARHRRIKVYGAPQIPMCGSWSTFAFQYERGLDAWTDTVPADTDILVTHTPAKYTRDLELPNELGCEYLAKEVKRVKPLLHVFGHVHWGAGHEVLWWDGSRDAYEKGMTIKSKWTHGILNPWLWWNAAMVVSRGIRGLIWDKVWGGQAPSTIAVNAAQMHGNTGKLGNPVQVVDI